MWLPVGVVCAVALILVIATVMDRRGRRSHRIRTGREVAGDFREEHRDARMVDRSNGLFIPPHLPRRDGESRDT